jgi:hypothetical protein
MKLETGAVRAAEPGPRKERLCSRTATQAATCWAQAEREIDPPVAPAKLNNCSLKVCRPGPGGGSGSCAEGGQSPIFFSMSYCDPQAHRRQCRKRRLVSGHGRG